MDLKVKIADGLELKNPIMNASGTFAYGEEFAEVMDLSTLGAVVTKGLSLNPKVGNPTPRITETPAGVLNAIGLENIGIESFIDQKLPGLRAAQVPVIANFFGNAEDEYVRCAEMLNGIEVDALEMNVSCPNVKKGGIQFGTDPKTLQALVARVRKVVDKPLIVKLSPMVSSIAEMAMAAQDGGADCLTCINTLPAMAIDEVSMRPVLGNVTGGLSGPAIKPVALKLVWEVSKVVEIPIVAAGGICDARDVIQFMLAGASAVEVGSASLRDPYCFLKIIDGLKEYLQHHKLERLADLTGALKI